MVKKEAQVPESVVEPTPEAAPVPEAVPAPAVEQPVPPPAPPAMVPAGFTADTVIRVRGNEADRLKFEFVNQDVSYIEAILLLEAVRDAVLLEALNRISKDKIRDLVDLKKLGVAMAGQKFAPATGGSPRD